MEKLFQLAVSLIAIILLARLATLLSKRLRTSAVAIQLLIGILLGPSLFNLLGSPIIIGTWGSANPTPLHGILKILAEIGLIQLMFLAGLRVDWHEMKTVFKSIFPVAGWSFVLTAVGVEIVSQSFVNRWPEAVALSATMGASSFGISTYNFSELGSPRSASANVIAGAAILSGLLAILLMIVSLSANYAASFGTFRMTIAVSWFMGKLIMFFAITYFLTSRFLSRVARNFEKRPRQMLIGYLLLVAALYAWGALHLGSFAAVGVASLGGALVAMSNVGLKEKITERFESGLPSLAVGIFLIVLGMGVNFREVKSYGVFLALLFITVIVAKAIGCWIGSRKALDPSRNRTLIVVGTLPQGEMGILIAVYLFSRGLVNPSVFAISIIIVVILTMLSATLTKIVLQGHRL